ncbi:MAG: hypothetical protein HPY66_3334 [Firmicutes bacterium]|nr:hypothetical protein [Bacillota bacterium]MDI6706924.1 MoaD/ThiS family protein [Bacillota bacterium]
MKIQVEVMGHLTDVVAGLERKQEVDLPDNTALSMLLSNLGIKRELAYMVLVNGQREDGSHLLRDGDRVTVFSPPAGG